MLQDLRFEDGYCIFFCFCGFVTDFELTCCWFDSWLLFFLFVGVCCKFFGYVFDYGFLTGF